MYKIGMYCGMQSMMLQRIKDTNNTYICDCLSNYATNDKLICTDVVTYVLATYIIMHII